MEHYYFTSFAKKEQPDRAEYLAGSELQHHVIALRCHCRCLFQARTCRIQATSPCV